VVKRLVTQRGSGPADQYVVDIPSVSDGKLRCEHVASTLERGRMKYVNLTASDEPSPRYAKTVVKGRGDPGTLLTAVLVVESALTLLLDELPPLAAVGGVLTPMTALGDSLIQRLRANGRIEIESGLVDNPDDEIGEDKTRLGTDRSS